MEENYGHLEIHLAKLLEEKGLNKYKLSLKASMNWQQVDSYCNNTITRLDTFVLCKLCTVLDCKIQDLLTFVPAEENNK
ncbi:MAG: helix-turn-helix transcriptional regulator [Lachnospiraceae bacterium]|nr:helix-turn-helix transcriptional regulator [Lachnospiraceae bacterium]